MLECVNSNRNLYGELHKVHIDYSVAPALQFNPVLPGMKFSTEKRPVQTSSVSGIKRPGAPALLLFDFKI